MKRLLIVLIILADASFGFAQNKPFKKVADELNQLTEKYARLSPFQDENQALKNFGLTYKDFPPDALEEGYQGYFSAQKDSIETYGLQEYFRERIREKLDALTTHKDFGKADIRKLVNIFATKSADNKVFNFVYDENTGGTYQSRISYIYYTGQRGEQPRDTYNPDGYDTIIPLKSKTATRYLMMGEVLGCSSCMGRYAKVVHYENGTPVTDFEYKLDTRIGFDNAIEYNPATATIMVHYFTDDLTQYCYCNEGDKPDDENESTTVHECSCVFKFDGDTFKLVSKKDTAVKN